MTAATVCAASAVQLADCTASVPRGAIFCDSCWPLYEARYRRKPTQPVLLEAAA